MFGTLLKESEFSKKFTWDELQDFAKSSTNPDNLLQKEFVDLVAKARKLYGSGKRKKP
jgi:Ca-activated chloride channel family protein